MKSELAKSHKPGGKMSKDRRFGERFIRSDAPGPKYDVQQNNQHIHSFVMAKRTTTSLKRQVGDLSASSHFRSDGRDSFITGSITASGLAQYQEHAHTFGPNYDPQHFKVSTHPSEHYGQPAPSKAPRFNNAEPHRNFLHLAAASPGPKYLPQHHNLELTTPKPPQYKLGLKLENAYLQRNPPPGRAFELVGPSSYHTKGDNTNTFKYQVPPKHPFDKANRVTAKVWISEEHASKMPEFMMKASPGPIYYPTNFEMAVEEKRRRRLDRPPPEGGRPAFV